ncbi:MAG TPA: hypothetical protein VI488_18130 [Candidatus Angelobacter sp.]
MGSRLDWQAFLFAPAGLGEVMKMASVNYVQGAEAIRNETVWGERDIEKTTLQKMLASAHGHDAEVLKGAIEACDGVERAHQVKDIVERGKQLWEVMVIESGTLQPMSVTDHRTPMLSTISAHSLAEPRWFLAKVSLERATFLPRLRSPLPRRVPFI